MATVMKIDTSGIEELIRKLDKLGADVNQLTEDVLRDAGRKVGDDCEAAVIKGNLPKGGKFSRGHTASTIIRDPEVEWYGTTASINVGFADYRAAAFLIKGTPRMSFVPQLHAMFREKRYMSDLSQEMWNTVNGRLMEEMK